MSPSRVLKTYYVVSLLLGLFLQFFLVHWVTIDEIGIKGAAIVTLSLNVLFIMLLPLVMDWAEHHYFKARFLEISEIAKTNPELALTLTEYCKKLHIPNLRLAIVETTSEELFSYGLWRNNLRLVLSNSLLGTEQRTKMIPSVEAELARFASQECTITLIMFAILEELLQLFCLNLHLFR